jgi:hypothetical protein
MATAIDRGDHTYVSPAGYILPGISSVLRAAGLLDSMPTGNEAAMQRGSRVHKAVEFDTTNELDEASMDEGELFMVHAARRARQDLKLDVIATEACVCNEALGYATKVDLVCKWDGKLTVVNYKTGNYYAHYPIQLALEALCFDEGVRRLAIYMRPSKHYLMQEYEDRADYAVARACATIAAWKRGQKHADKMMEDIPNEPEQ